MMKIDSSLRQAKCDKVVQQERELGINEIGELQPYQDECSWGSGHARDAVEGSTSDDAAWSSTAEQTRAGRRTRARGATR